MLLIASGFHYYFAQLCFSKYGCFRLFGTNSYFFNLFLFIYLSLTYTKDVV